MNTHKQEKLKSYWVYWDIHNEPGAPAGTISGASVVVVAADVVAVVVVDFFG